MANNEQIYQKLGELDAKVELILSAQKQQVVTQSQQDERLRKTEIQAAKNGLWSGGFVSIAIGFLKDAIKSVP